MPGQSQVRIQFRPAPDLPPLPAAVEVAIFRITEEAVTNIIKHAGARLATVDLGMAGGGIRLEIADDGQGIRGPDSGGAGTGFDAATRRRTGRNLSGRTAGGGKRDSGDRYDPGCRGKRRMSGAEPTRILIAEDHPLFLKGLRALVAAEADLEIVGEVE